MQQQNVFNKNTSKISFKVGTAERKLMIVFIYYIFLASIALTTFTISTRDSELFANSLQEYFLCELRGHDPSNPCTRESSGQTATAFGTLSYMLLGLYPTLNLVFALNISDLKESCRRKRKERGFSASTNLSTNLSTNFSSSCKPV